MAKTVTLTVLKDGAPASGARVILADPFNKAFNLSATGKVSKSLPNDFATVCGVVIRGTGFEAGTQLAIDVEKQTDYTIEV